MTPSVADKTPIPTKVWRRHTDPPGLWISVVIGSVSLHLLAFWLMRSSQFSRLWQQPNEATIPIEVVEIYSETKPRTRKVASEPKPVSPKQPSTIQKLQAVKLPKQVVPKDKLTVKSALSGQDKSAIALTNNKNAIAQQRQRQQELAQQNGSPLQEPRTQTGQAPRTENDGTIAQTHTAGGVIVSWIPLTPSQQTILMRTDFPKDIKLPELAQSTKQDSTIAIQQDLGLKTGNFLFSLSIEANGVCSKAVLLPGQNISPDERGIYEQFAFEEVCQKNKFNPAYELADQTKKQASYLFVRFKIQPANSN